MELCKKVFARGLRGKKITSTILYAVHALRRTTAYNGVNGM